MTDTLVLPDGREIARPRWLPSVEQAAERDRDLRSRYFLLRIGGNDGVGEVWRCRRCRGRHTYMTASCIERPFNGIDQIVYAVFQQAGDLAAVKSVNGQARASAVLKPVMALPDLAEHHPEMARQRAQTAGLALFDIEVAGVRLGRVEEIAKTFAQRLLTRINQNRPEAGRLQIEGLVT